MAVGFTPHWGLPDGLCAHTANFFVKSLKTVLSEPIFLTTFAAAEDNGQRRGTTRERRYRGQQTFVKRVP